MKKLEKAPHVLSGAEATFISTTAMRAAHPDISEDAKLIIRAILGDRSVSKDVLEAAEAVETWRKRQRKR